MAEAVTEVSFAWAWTFRFGLDSVRRSYWSILDANQREAEQLERDWRAFQKQVEAGEALDEEFDEHGNMIHSYGEEVGERLYELAETASLSREAFVLVLHHFWEREVKRRTKQAYNQDEAVKWLQGRGLAPDVDGLTVLRATANLLKHDEQKWADKLFRLRPGLFDQNKMADDGLVNPTREYLNLDKEALEYFFEVIRQSGPKPKRPPFASA